MNFRLLLLNCCLLLGLCFVSAATAASDVSQDDLKKVEAMARQQSLEHQKLQQQAAKIGQELAKVNQDMISTARKIQNSEDKLSRMEKQLEHLQHDLTAAEESFRTEDANLVKTLSAIQNLALKPTESLLVQPLTPVDIIRSAIILRETVPYLDANAQQIRHHFTQIAMQKSKIEKQVIEITKQKKSLQTEHRRMQNLAQAKASLKTKVEIKSAQAQKNMDKLASQAQDLRDLLQKIEQQRTAKRASRKLEEKQSADLIKSGDGSITGIVSGFAKAKGSLSLPARGSIISRYGDQKVKGVTSKGLTIATRPSAQVIAPFDGTVIFAGPFRSYGDMIIVEHDDGYLSLLAGLGQIDVELGQMLLAGEPVGLMPQDNAELYIEIRKNNQPINPDVWFKL
ncbi:MAG: peptidoglycan DD-metalloendopeptidase family protein [Alphaproteobacteria bacterium]|nr:peptidoglycan DD-metalloendopeptidase family protein [Alphaproteobacteria bacterium]MBQ9236171.1 peptidoglycan DD-metalloendopeptidase family protein [Alphaproteobacteria bacterium]